MNLSKIYTVLFTEGSAGTFLIWFVSQHDNFFKLHHTYKNQYKDTVKNTTVNLPNNTYHLAMNVGSFKYSIQSLDQYLARHFALAFRTDLKIIFKILPHDYPLVNKHIDHLPNINIIMLIVENYDWVNSRLESFGGLTRIVTELPQKRIYQNQQNLQQYFKNKGINYCNISINKILKLDTAEYQKLLEFIDAPPIDNWQDIIKEYKDNVGIQEII
jgi:hypothetical protein